MFHLEIIFSLFLQHIEEQDAGGFSLTLGYQEERHRLLRICRNSVRLPTRCLNLGAKQRHPLVSALLNTSPSPFRRLIQSTSPDIFVCINQNDEFQIIHKNFGKSTDPSSNNTAPNNISQVSTQLNHLLLNTLPTIQYAITQLQTLQNSSQMPGPRFLEIAINILHNDLASENLQKIVIQMLNKVYV